MQGLFPGQGARRRRALLAFVLDLQQRRAAQAKQRIVRIDRLAKKDDSIPFIFKPLAGNVFRLFDQADHPHRRGRIDGPGRVLVVQADVAACHRRAKRLAGLGQAAHALFKLPKQLRIVRITKVQIVRRPERPCPGAD